MAKTPPASRFASLKQLRDKPPAEEPVIEQAAPPEPAKTEAPRNSGGRPAGKRSNPDFRPVNLVLRKQTQRDANRRLEDEDDKRDLSELVEDLLAEWLRR